MNTQTLPQTGTVAHIEVGALKPNPWNRTRELDAAFVDSIRTQGVLCALTVRTLDPEYDTYQIIAGERRFRAALAVGILDLPCLVLEMDDQAAQTCTLIENTHREDMTPWQEAELIGSLLSREDWDIATIAAATGWSESMIRRRAKLLDISPSWKKAVDEGTLHAWTTAHFEVLAVFDEKSQEAFYKDLHYRAKGFTLSELKEEIASESKALKAAPFDLDDVTLVPKAGACSACPKRSDAQADIFGEVPDIVKAGASCLDESCFKRKLSAHVQRKADTLLAKHPDAVKVAVDYSIQGKGFLRSHEATPAKKGDKGAVPALNYAEGGKVTLGYVKLRKSAEAKDKSPKALAKEAEKKREARITALAIEKLLAIVQDPDTEFHDEAEPLLVQFCLLTGNQVNAGSADEDVRKRVRAYAKKPPTLPELWEAAADQLKRDLNQAKWGLENGWGADDELPAVEFAAWMVDEDFAALRKEAAEELAQGNPAPANAGDDTEDMDEGLDGESEGDL